ncbi:MAG: hypothetical protein K8L99_00245 [Anaerolineae bacterium]|nr:hypothetical protein [Anaerolineae bacterium]
MINVGWYENRQDVIYMRFEPGWRWEELKAAIQQADDMIVSRDYTVHLLIDVRQAGSIPRDLRQMVSELMASGSARANEGHKVVIGASRLLKTAYQGLHRLYGMHERPLLFADTPAEAEKLTR